MLPLLASTTRDNYNFTLNKYLLPVFAETSLREMNTLMLQRYFSGLRVSHASATKIKDVVASIMSSAVRFGILVKNPLDGVKLARPRTAKKPKPIITPEQFQQVVDSIAEPYSTMV